MHELGILRQIVRTVVQIAEKNSIENVKHITLEVGLDSGIVPHYMNKLFPAASDSLPLLKNAELRIDQEHCVGCGICRSRCSHDVIHIRQTMPMRKDLHEYFLKDYNLDIKLGAMEHEKTK